jgi:hypothetical protein
MAKISELYEAWEVADLIRKDMRLDDDAEVIPQNDGSFLVVWERPSMTNHETKTETK